MSAKVIVSLSPYCFINRHTGVTYDTFNKFDAAKPVNFLPKYRLYNSSKHFVFIPH